MASVAVAGAGQPEDDVDAVVRTAQDRLLRAIQVANLGGDPLGAVMEALAADLGARHLMHTAAVKQANQPTATFTEQQVHTLGRHLAAGCAAWAPRLRKSLDRRTAVVGVAAMALFGAAMFWAGGHWRPTPDISGMTCGLRDDHSRVCWIDVAPAPPQQPPAASPTRAR
jgi:hypothetical protein